MPVALTLEEWTDAPDGDRALAAELAHGQFEEEQRHSGAEQHDHVRNQERSCEITTQARSAGTGRGYV